MPGRERRACPLPGGHPGGQVLPAGFPASRREGDDRDEDGLRQESRGLAGAVTVTATRRGKVACWHAAGEGGGIVPPSSCSATCAGAPGGAAAWPLFVPHGLAPCGTCRIWHCPACGCRPGGARAAAAMSTVNPGWMPASGGCRTSLSFPAAARNGRMLPPGANRKLSAHLLSLRSPGPRWCCSFPSSPGKDLLCRERRVVRWR